jgi:hypothetical protein
LKDGLPGTTDYDYTPILPEEIHIAIAAKQVLAGMHASKRTIHMNTTLPMIPKKREQRLNFLLGSQGWGLHAVQGFSITRILTWIASLTSLGVVFIIMCLVFINKTDLQNAFIPVGFFMTMIALALGIPQLLGNA